MGFHSTHPFTNWFDAILCLIGLAAIYYVLKQFRLPPRLRWFISLLIFVTAIIRAEHIVPENPRWFPSRMQDAVSGSIYAIFVGAVGCSILLALRKRVPGIDKERRSFLRTATAAVCATPAIAAGLGFAKRTEAHIVEFDLPVPSLPSDLHGLRLLQISDIHFGVFFDRNALRRVVDSCNELRADLAFVTGDFISDQYDPLDECLLELSRLRSASGAWGCNGNHEFYANLDGVVAAKASRIGINVLRHQTQRLRFGNSTINLSGIDFAPHAPFVQNPRDLISEGDFNLLLAHTPQAFPEAADAGFDLVLSGHTHGGQLNLQLGNTNLNIADLRTPYTRGLYTRGKSQIYVNSGLGTIGVPIRLGAPAEITLIRLCKS